MELFLFYPYNQNVVKKWIFSCLYILLYLYPAMSDEIMCFYTVSHCPLEKMLFFLDCCLFCKDCFLFCVLLVPSQFVTTENVHFGIWLIPYHFVVLPQQFEKQNQNPTTVFLRSWNPVKSHAAEQMGVCLARKQLYRKGLGVLEEKKLNGTQHLVCNKGQNALSCVRV